MDILEQSHLDIVRFIFREMVTLRPPFCFEVCHDMYSCCYTGLIAKKLYDLLDALLMVAHFSVPHAIFRGSCILVEPYVYLLKWVPEFLQALYTMIFEFQSDSSCSYND